MIIREVGRSGSAGGIQLRHPRAPTRLSMSRDEMKLRGCLAPKYRVSGEQLHASFGMSIKLVFYYHKNNATNLRILRQQCTLLDWHIYD